MSTSSRSVRMAVAVGAPALAYVAQKLLWPYIPPSPQLLFYPAVFVAARLGGARAGYLASVLSAIAITYGFLPPVGFGFAIDDARDALDLGIFMAVSVAMSHAVGRLAERMAREQRAREAMQATWSIFAHDLRTPLHTIRMGSDLLAHHQGPSSDADVRRHAEIIERSSMRAASLVEDALDAMRIGEGSIAIVPAPCGVHELVARVADEASVLASRAGIRLETTVTTTRATVLCDGARIAQVLANLLANAVRFTPRGGSIAIIAEDDVGDAGDVRDVRITVRDTGKGIGVGDLANIFAKRWTSGGGHGLGLWIAQTIVEAHARTLTVSSEEGAGTAFAFSLPAG
jgi:two-component system, chemotaxis family, sensor kinase Cph1